MRPTTLCFPVRSDGKLLLGRKKRGFGVSKWNGFGGKIEAGEDFLQCAVRELQEETGLIAREEDLELVGFLVFSFFCLAGTQPHRFCLFPPSMARNCPRNRRNGTEMVRPSSPSVR